jgi:hypothetical protein
MLSPFAFNQRRVKATKSPIVRDIPDGTYVELVASLCGTRMRVTQSAHFRSVSAPAMRADGRQKADRQPSTKCGRKRQLPYHLNKRRLSVIARP